MPHRFASLARAVSRATGRPGAFIAAAALVLGWAATGPLFDFSDTWSLWINSATTIITFLMVFLLQHTQSVDTRAMQAKLDELIRAIEPADNRLRGIERNDDAGPGGEPGPQGTAEV